MRILTFRPDPLRPWLRASTSHLNQGVRDWRSSGHPIHVEILSLRAFGGILSFLEWRDRGNEHHNNAVEKPTWYFNTWAPWPVLRNQWTVHLAEKAYCITNGSVWHSWLLPLDIHDCGRQSGFKLPTKVEFSNQTRKENTHNNYMFQSPPTFQSLMAA